MKAELVYSPDDRDLVEKQPLYRELAERHSPGLQVILMWLRRTNTVWLELIDEAQGLDTTFCVPSDRALEAFYHPYAYRPPQPPSQELVVPGE